MSFEGWRLDIAKRELWSPDNVLVQLSAGEFDLLLAFVEHPQRILTRDQLLDLARGRSPMPFDRSIDVQVSRLRRKIEPDPQRADDDQDGAQRRLYLHVSRNGLTRRMLSALANRIFSAGIAVRLGFTVSDGAGSDPRRQRARLPDRPGGGPPPRHHPREMVERVSAIIRLADETPPQFRPRVVRAVDAPGLEVEWRPTAPDFHHNQTGFPFGSLRRRMREALDDPNRES